MTFSIVQNNKNSQRNGKGIKADMTTKPRTVFITENEEKGTKVNKISFSLSFFVSLKDGDDDDDDEMENFLKSIRKYLRV